MSARRMTGRAILRDITTGILKRIEGLSDRELRALRRHLSGLSQTNCWWLEYEMQHALCELVENAIRSRAFQRRAAAQKKRRRKVQP